MAQGWLKIEGATPDKPEVWAMSELLNIDPDDVFGKLFRVWFWFDQHTENGNSLSVTKKLLDRTVGVTGFADVMISVGWMTEENGEISLPNFKRHNGETAKKRALSTRRVEKHRSKTCNTKSVTNSVTKPLPEKRREDNKKINKKKFTPPTVTEVSDYINEKKLNLDPDGFVNFYASKDWMVGRNKMKDWKCAANGWSSRNNKPQQDGHSEPRVRVI